MQCLPPLTSSGLKSPTTLLRDRSSAAEADQPTLAEVFASTVADGAITGFTLAYLHRYLAAAPGKPVLWVQDRLSRREAGRPCLAGLPANLAMIYVDVSKPVDVLWCMEEALRCQSLAAVVGEVWGDPPVLDFTASKRLALRAEAQATPTVLMRRAATANLSAARERWRITSLPARVHPHDARAPGAPAWQAALFRARWRAPGQWVAGHDAQGLSLTHEVSHDMADPAPPPAAHVQAG